MFKDTQLNILLFILNKNDQVNRITWHLLRLKQVSIVPTATTDPKTFFASKLQNSDIAQLSTGLITNSSVL